VEPIFLADILVVAEELLYVGKIEFRTELYKKKSLIFSLTSYSPVRNKILKDF
jgi:hypothetical protein